MLKILINYLCLNWFNIFLSLQIRLQSLLIPESISYIYFTLLVLKLDKFKEVKEEQLKNIHLILVTLLILKLDKFKEVKEEHRENI